MIVPKEESVGLVARGLSQEARVVMLCVKQGERVQLFQMEYIKSVKKNDHIYLRWLK